MTSLLRKGATLLALGSPLCSIDTLLRFRGAARRRSAWLMVVVGAPGMLQAVGVGRRGGVRPARV